MSDDEVEGVERGLADSIGDLPDNVVETVKAMVNAGVIDPKNATYEGLPTLGEGFTDALNTGEHVNHEGLVDMAHKDGLVMTYTEPVQIPNQRQQTTTKETDANGNRRKAADGESAIFRAVVVTERGVFTAYADSNQNDTMVDAIVRMAETRALNRALRTAVNVGNATAEEMPDSGGGIAEVE